MESIWNVIKGFVRVIFFLTVVVPIIVGFLAYGYGHTQGVIDGTYRNTYHAIYEGRSEEGHEMFRIEEGPRPEDPKDRIDIAPKPRVTQMYPPGQQYNKN